jgi:hypothetical protein
MTATAKDDPPEAGGRAKGSTTTTETAHPNIRRMNDEY